MKKLLDWLDLHQEHGKVVSGMDAVSEAVQKNKVKLVLITSDISDKSKENIEYVCTKHQIKVIRLKCTMENLGKAIGKKDRAIIGIKDKSFSDGIIKKLSGEDLLYE